MLWAGYQLLPVAIIWVFTMSGLVLSVLLRCDFLHEKAVRYDKTSKVSHIGQNTISFYMPKWYLLSWVSAICGTYAQNAILLHMQCEHISPHDY